MAGGLALLLGAARPDLSGDEAAPNRYIGAARCKTCHKDAAGGDQFGHWEESKHAKAFEMLASKEALAVGKEHDVKEPQTDPKCLKCHVTAFGEPKENLHRTFKPALGVQCETCHGPGEEHVRARMKAAGEADAGGAKYTVIPDEEMIKSPAPTVCAGCHNDQSPSYKPFCFHESAEQIRHLNPNKPRTEEELATLTACNCEAECKCLKDSKDGKCTIPPKGGDVKKDDKK